MTVSQLEERKNLIYRRQRALSFPTCSIGKVRPSICAALKTWPEDSIHSPEFFRRSSSSCNVALDWTRTGQGRQYVNRAFYLKLCAAVTELETDTYRHPGQHKHVYTPRTLYVMMYALYTFSMMSLVTGVSGVYRMCPISIGLRKAQAIAPPVVFTMSRYMFIQNGATHTQKKIQGHLDASLSKG